MLKNAIEFLYHEWTNKAAGFVSYGADAGGARAVQHLRVILGELHVADVRTMVPLSLSIDFTNFTDFTQARPPSAGRPMNEIPSSPAAECMRGQAVPARWRSVTLGRVGRQVG